MLRKSHIKLLALAVLSAIATHSATAGELTGPTSQSARSGKTTSPGTKHVSRRSSSGGNASVGQPQTSGSGQPIWMQQQYQEMQQQADAQNQFARYQAETARIQLQMMVDEQLRNHNTIGLAEQNASSQRNAPKSQNAYFATDGAGTTDTAAGQEMFRSDFFQDAAEVGITAYDWATEPIEMAAKTGVRAVGYMADKAVEHTARQTYQHLQDNPGEPLPLPANKF